MSSSPPLDLHIKLETITPLVVALQTIHGEKSHDVTLSADGPNLRLSTSQPGQIHASTILPPRVFTHLSLSPTLHALINHSLLQDALFTLPPATPVELTLHDGEISARSEHDGHTQVKLRTVSGKPPAPPPYGNTVASGHAACAAVSDAISDANYGGASVADVVLGDTLRLISRVGAVRYEAVVGDFDGDGDTEACYSVPALTRVARALPDDGVCEVAVDTRGSLKVVSAVGDAFVEFVAVAEAHKPSPSVALSTASAPNPSPRPRRSPSTITAPRPGARAPVPVALVVFSYALSSLGGVFVNKACLTVYSFGHTITLLLLQLTVSVFALSVLRLTPLLSIPPRSFADLSVLAFPAVFFIANVTVGLLALKLVNIPMFSAFRRLSVLAVMLLEYFVLGKTASKRILVTVSVMVVGSFLAGLGDLSFDPTGYALVFLNNIITAANLVSIKKATQILKLDALSFFYYVSALALPPVFILSIISGELPRALSDVFSRPELQTIGFASALTASAASAFLVNFFTNLCTQMTSPLTTSITGQMKNVLQTVLGIFAFGYVVTPLNLFGLAVALLGSLLFARFKWLEARAAREDTAGESDEENVVLKKEGP